MEAKLLNCMIKALVRQETVEALLEEELDSAQVIASVSDELLRSCGLKAGQIGRIRCSIAEYKKAGQDVENCSALSPFEISMSSVDSEFDTQSRTSVQSQPSKSNCADSPMSSTHSKSSSSKSSSSRSSPSLSSSSKSSTTTTKSQAPANTCPTTSSRPAFSHTVEKKPKQDWLLSFKLPHTFSPALSKALEVGKNLSSDMRNELTRDVCSSIRQHTMFPKDDERKEVSRMLVKKYPFLGDTLGSSSIDSWTKAINFRFKTMRRNKAVKRPALKTHNVDVLLKKRKNSEVMPVVDGETRETCIEHAREIKKEMAKTSNKNYVLIKELMDATYTDRRSRILGMEATSVEQILTEYPALQLVSELKAELSRILERRSVVKHMTDAFVRLQPKLFKLAVDKNVIPNLTQALEDNPHNKSKIEGAASVIALPILLKDRSQESAVIKICSENESVDKAIEESVFPRLVGAGEIDDIDPLYIVAEGKLVAKLSGTSVGLPMALVLLMGTYYIFNIEYPLKAKNVYLFLEAILLDNTAEAKKRVALQKFLKELE